MPKRACTAASPRIPEKVVQSQVVALLRAVGATVWVTGTRRPAGDYQGTRMTPGLPDVLAFLSRVGFLSVEVKAAGGRLSDGQRAWADCCQQAGVPHIVGGVEDVFRWLAARGVVRPENVPHYRRQV